MRIELHFGDITELNTDCIVNAAKPSLLGGGGVDGTIHKKAGSKLKEYCKSLRGCEIGEAKITPGFESYSKFIIHTVGPRVSLFNLQVGEEEIEKLKQSYLNSLKLGSKNKFNDLVFSNISTGSYGFPKDLAAKISFEIVANFLNENEYPKKVTFCCYDIDNLQSYVDVIKRKL
jgi:O-acetyl-ADP-ribose deacetylase (regulator of RNase III)